MLLEIFYNYWNIVKKTVIRLVSITLQVKTAIWGWFETSGLGITFHW